MAVTTLGGTLSGQARIIFACVTRILQMKTRETPLGIFSNLVEPLATILIMTLVMTQIKFRLPKLGDYLMVFFMTAVLPISMFRQGAMEAERAFYRLKRNLVLPQMHPLDLMISGIVTSMLTMVTLFLAVTTVFVLIYEIPWPENIVFCFIPTFCNALMGLGMGALNMVIKSWFFYWGTIFATVAAPIGVLSGMFYTAETLPPSAVEILYWNPFFHSTELLRTFYYAEYTSDFFDPYYYYGWTFGLLFTGLLCERVFRYRLLNEKK